VIVGYIPGHGHTIKNARVVLKPDETLPNRYNVVEAEVLRQHPDTYEEILIKPVGTVLPADSDILSNPEIQLGTVLDLTITTGEGNLYEHADIIRLDEDGETDNDDGGDVLAGADDSGPLVP
jgi:hypothetical protein